MILLNGKYNEAKVFTDNVEPTAIGQVIELCNQEYLQGSKLRFMPDIHAGTGATIGTTATLVNNKVCPSTIGVDIGCGMLCVEIKEKHIELQKLDKVIRQYVPSGFGTRSKNHALAAKTRVNDLICAKKVNTQRALASIGTLGGGNHFLEVNKSEDGRLFLVVHTGSRNFGKQIAEHYQKVAFECLSNRRDERTKIVETLKAQGRENEITEALKAMPSTKISKDLAYVSGNDFDEYIHDMQIAQEYAVLNRQAIAQEIVSNMGLNVVNEFTTIHNYIDMDKMIIRKGAVSAEAGETLLIPMNMRDGSLIWLAKATKTGIAQLPTERVG